MKLAILCSGQAGQHAGMLDQLLADPASAGLRATASELLGRDLADWWHGLGSAEIFANANAQFAIALCQIAAWARLAPLLPEPPAVVAGYSLGEVLAWHVAGALDAAATLRLVRARAGLMDRHAPAAGGAGCMLLWRGRMSPARRAAVTRALAAHGLAPAIERAAGERVFAGPAAAVDAVLADAAVAGAELKRLAVGVPSHTAWLAGAVAPFRAELDAAPLRDPCVAVLAGIDGSVLRQRRQALDYLPRQIAQALRWDWCVDTLASLGVDTALEMGPGKDLAQMTEAALPGVRARALEDFAGATDIRDWLNAAGRAGAH